MEMLVNFERHSSVSSHDSALTWKLFMGEFLNTAILPLIIFERSDWQIKIGSYKTTPFANGEFQGFPTRLVRIDGLAISIPHS